ncbi:agmatinase family protein [Magnetovirga frankeli]|uniref:agmatinase family protein n=1 Tax=Magnetovirga frankeli TaxID=947516 RepID=UPI001292EB90|nr:agmatinase family protein [gamma proteobacterium SS-5]
MLEPLAFADAIAQLELGTPPHPEAGFLGGRLRPEDAALLLIPVPWEATTSYGGGTSEGPNAILQASHQLDLQDPFFGEPFRAGIAFAEENEEIAQLNAQAKAVAQQVIEALEQGEEAATVADSLDLVNQASERVNQRVYQQASAALGRGQRVGLVGGDHSSPFGLIQALAERYPSFSILHIDAHHDLRQAYEGFEHSHASIFYNVMAQIPQVSRLVQLGVRDYHRSEVEHLQGLGQRGRCFYDAAVSQRLLQGEPFAAICGEILDALGDAVYISLDIDGLDPVNCPSTGTPVPGGLSYAQMGFLLEQLSASGRQIIGFDLCEVAPPPNGGDWDANVAARLLYRLCGCLLYGSKAQAGG